MHEGLLQRLHVPLQRRNVTAYSALGDRTGQRQQQPPDPLRRQPRVIAQPLLDLLPPAVQTPDPLGRHAHRRCRPGYGRPDRLDVQLQPPGDFLLRHTLHQMQVADFGPLRHPDHLRVLPDSVDETTLSRRVGSSPGNPLFPRAQGVPFQVATGSLFILPLPGEYYGPDGFRQMRGYPVRVESSPASHDPDTARRLWVVSEELTGVRFPI